MLAAGVLIYLFARDARPERVVESIGRPVEVKRFEVKR
jgi:hypothetical protein